MHIAIIAAVQRDNYGIGMGGQLLFRLKDDLAHFKRKTQGHFVLMGRKTYESLPVNAEGKRLSGRKLIVLSRDTSLSLPDPEAMVANSFQAACLLAEAQGESELFVAGGEQIYQLALPYATRMYLSVVEAQEPADAFFPVFDQTTWRVRCRITYPVSDRNMFAFQMLWLERRS